MVSLREVETSERILATKSLLKESISVWNEDVRPNQTNAIALDFLKKQLNEIAGDLEYSSLESNAKEVAAVVAGNVAEKLINRSQCVECQNSLTTTGSQQSSSEFDYLLKLSRGGLILPPVDLAQYVSKSFAMLDTASNIIFKSTLPERVGGESVLTINTCAQSFLCEQHTVNIKFINRIICNVYFNNAQSMKFAKMLCNSLGINENENWRIRLPFEIISRRSYSSICGLGTIRIEIFCNARHS